MTKRKKYSSPEYDAAQNEFLKKNYKHYVFSLRRDKDGDLYEAWREAKDMGLTSRAWLRLMFYGEERDS